MIHIYFPKGLVMVHLFMLVLVLLDYTRLTNSRDLRFALYILLEIFICVDEVAIRDKPGKNRGVIGK